MRLVIILSLLFCVLSATADGVEDSQETSLEAAQQAYDAENFVEAANILEALMAARPNCAECSHLLGKSYGQLAEQANWTRAMGLAKKTRIALEQAVDLDPNNANALADLIKYYRAAPGFLGGDEQKADRLEHRLSELLDKNTS